MKIRLEVGKSKTSAWEWFLRQAKRHASHRIEADGKLEIHVLEFSDPSELGPYFDVVKSWKMVSIYRDGKLLTRADAYGIVWKNRMKDGALEALTKTLRDTNREILEKRLRDQFGGDTDLGPKDG